MLFAIVKDKVSFVGYEEVRWLKVTDPLKTPEIISRGDALQLIRENNMIKVFSNDDGTIWDCPDKDWTYKYKGCFARQTKQQLAERRAKLMDNA